MSLKIIVKKDDEIEISNIKTSEQAIQYFAKYGKTS